MSKNVYVFSWEDKYGNKIENQIYTVGHVDSLLSDLEEWGCTNIKMKILDEDDTPEENQVIAEKLYAMCEDMDAMDYCDTKDEEIELIKNSLDEIMGKHTVLYEAIKRCVGV